MNGSAPGASNRASSRAAPKESNKGRHEERALLCRQAARKFDGATAERLAAALTGVGDPARLAQVGDWIIECPTAADLLARVAGTGRRGD